MAAVLDWTLIPSATGFLFKAKETIAEIFTSSSKTATTIKLPNDFFSTILSLVILNYSPNGTKLVLDGSRFSAHSKSIWQGITRRIWYFESIDKQAEVATAIALYAVFLEPHKADNLNAKAVLKAAKAGLKKLKATYKEEKGEKHCSRDVIKKWRKLIDEALAKPATIEDLNDNKKAFLKTIYDCWEDKLSILAAMVKEAERLQGDVDPNKEILCPRELSYIAFIQEDKAKILPTKFAEKFSVQL